MSETTLMNAPEAKPKPRLDDLEFYPDEDGVIRSRLLPRANTEANAQAATPEGGVAEVKAMLDRSADPTQAPALSEREKRWELRKLHSAGLSRDIVAAKDEDGKIKMVQGKDGQWRIKTRLDLNAYAKHNKDDAYAVAARKSGYGKTAKEYLHEGFIAARERLQSSSLPKTKTEKEATKDKKTRTMAAIGGLAVAKVTSLFGKDKPAEPSKANTVARNPVPALQKTTTDSTKEMPAVPAAVNTDKQPNDKPEQLTKRQKITRGIGVILVAASFLGAAGYAAHEADKHLAANSRAADDPEVTHTNKDNVEQETETTTTEYPKVDVNAQIKHDAVPGEVVNNVVTAASKTERTLSLPDDGNIWNSSRAFLEQQGVTPTAVNIDVIADAVRAAEGLSEDDAEELPVGYTFTIPADALTRVK